MYKTQLIKSSTQARFLTVRQLSSTSQLLKWNDIPLAPPDKILGISEAYNNDSNPQKINLGVGAYRDNSGKPIIFPSVKKAEEILLGKETEKEYTAIVGSKNFQSIVKNFIFKNGFILFFLLFPLFVVTHFFTLTSLDILIF